MLACVTKVTISVTNVTALILDMAVGLTIMATLVFQNGRKCYNSGHRL